MDIPAGGSALDKRLVPGESLARGLFYGIPWATAEGKTMAAKVAEKKRCFFTAIEYGEAVKI
jgi:hypothetical protein